MACGCEKNSANNEKFSVICAYKEAHKDEPELIKAYLQGHKEANEALITYLESVLKVVKGNLTDNDLGGLLAGAYYMVKECEED